MSNEEINLEELIFPALIGLSANAQAEQFQGLSFAVIKGSNTTVASEDVSTYVDCAYTSNFETGIYGNGITIPDKKVARVSVESDSFGMLFACGTGRIPSGSTLNTQYYLLEQHINGTSSIVQRVRNNGIADNNYHGFALVGTFGEHTRKTDENTFEFSLMKQAGNDVQDFMFIVLAWRQ